MNDRPLLPVALFPPLAWFVHAQRHGCEVCIHEHYVKQSIRNRIALTTSNGAVNLSVPVDRRGAASRVVSSILFTERVRPSLLLKFLQTNYGRAPYFEHYMEHVELWAHDHLQPRANLVEAALASTRWACHELNWQHPPLTDAYQTSNGQDDWRIPSNWTQLPNLRYPQVFEDRLGFVEGRSILDVLFHLGPEAATLPSQHGNCDIGKDSPA